ncbi:neuromedin Ba [Callorhinchus milii]|uniref:Neuromedin B-like protein n=1 Tax=Callorhinchus milii TaxID=7868 RepID=V9LAK9_CALMI|nr:neuromedin Ba [Callorhinchus milii]|eukprot:gi/632979064/ref/XP_007906262.1/ PREDICTED: neuromedin-B [Callorhinchus milii]
MAVDPVARLCRLALLVYLLVFPYVSVTAGVSLDLTALRNKVSKINVNPRGNLWATGHFMGKKSLLDYADGEATNTARIFLNVPDDPKDFKALLSQKVLEVVLRQEADGKRMGYGSLPQGMGLIMKILESYIENK